MVSSHFHLLRAGAGCTTLKIQKTISVATNTLYFYPQIFLKSLKKQVDARLYALIRVEDDAIPGIVNTFIGLFKDTTLVLFIGLFDPLGLSNTIRATTEWNGIYWELFIFIGVLFFIFCFSMGRYSLFLERKLQRENR